MMHDLCQEVAVTSSWTNLILGVDKKGGERTFFPQ